MTEQARPRTPAAGAAVFLFLTVLLLQVAVALLLDRLDLPDDLSLLVTPLLLLFVTGFAVIRLGVDVRETLLLRLPARADLLMAFPLAISFFVLGDQLSLLTQELFPLPDEILEGSLRMLRAEGARQWAFKVGTIGLGAALSEELLFRGFIQTALLSRMSRWSAVLWTAFLFTMLHMLPLPTFAAAGLVLGLAAVATKSILVPIVIHFTNNLAALLLVNLAGLETLGEPLWIAPSILLPALAMFVLTTGYYLRRMPPEAPREKPAPARARPERLTLASDPVPLATVLADVPPERRRLGWLVVAAAVVLGVFVLTTLFAVSIYLTSPEQAHARAIDVMKAKSAQELSSDARDKAPRLAAAFDALAALNRSGTLELGDVTEVMALYARVSGDGVIDEGEADALIDRIRGIVTAKTRPRRL